MSDDLAAILDETASSAPSAAPAAPAAPTDPTDIPGMVRATAQKYGIDPDMAERWAKQESGFDPKATSKKGAVGVLQLMPDTAKAYGVTDRTDPAQNIDGGMRYLTDLKKQFGGDNTKAFAAYNAGPKAVVAAGGVPNDPETQAYVKAIVGVPDDVKAVMGPGSVSDDEAEAAYQKAFGGEGSQAVMGPNGQFRTLDTNQPLTQGQSKTGQILAKGGFIDPTAPRGTKDNPWFQREPADTYKPGDFYVDQLGSVRQQPGVKTSGFLGQLGSGLGESGVDLGASLARLAPGASNSTLGNLAKGNQLFWNAEHGDSGAAQIGRGVGDFVLPAVLTGATGEGLALAGRAVPELAALTRFVTGSGAAFKANPAIWGASKIAEGLGAGGEAAALSSGTSDKPLGEQIKEGALIGGPANLLLPGGVAAAKGVASGVRGLVEPFSEGGRSAIVSRFLAKQAEGGPTALDTTEYVPGSSPTLAQATGNPKLAMVEQAVKTRNPTPFDALQRGNQQARELAVDAVRGDKQSLDDLIAARSAHTDPMREAAFAHTTPVDPTPVVKAIDETLASPAGQRDAVVSTLQNLRSKLVNEDGSLQTDPAQLWGVRQAIGDMVSPLSAGTKADGRLASRELLGIRDKLDPVIEGGAPGFKDYLNAYSDASNKVDAQEYLQKQNLTTADGTISLGKVDSVIKRLEADRMKGGAHPAKNIPDESLGALYNLRSDLQRQSQGFVGRGTGSNTVDKLASNQLLNSLSIPSAIGLSFSHPLAAPVIGLGKLALAAQNKKIEEALTNRLLNPSPVDAINVAPAQSRLLGRIAGRSVLPATSEVGRNMLFTP